MIWFQTLAPPVHAARAHVTAAVEAYRVRGHYRVLAAVDEDQQRIYDPTVPEALSSMEKVLVAAREALNGERVRLRELRDADLPTLVDWWRRPDVAVFNDRVQPRPDKPLEDMFRHWSENASAAGAGFCVETLDGDLVGHVALWGAEVRNRCATFGIMIGPEHQSKGLGSDATRLMVNYGFSELGLHRIELMVNADNDRAIAAYRRAGFEQEGLFRAKLFYAGRFHDQVFMAALSQSS